MITPPISCPVSTLKVNARPQISKIGYRSVLENVTIAPATICGVMVIAGDSTRSPAVIRPGGCGRWSSTSDQ